MYRTMSMQLIAAILVSFLATSFTAHAQYYKSQNNVWAFGVNGGVNFSSGAPVPFTSAINTPEGVAAVSDSAGNLLFYTNGLTVWNKTNAIMPHGDTIVPFGTWSCAQAAVILPKIDSPGKYYLFSIATGGQPGRVAYSVIDMSLDGGLGDVRDTGFIFHGGMSERMIAIPGANCNYWLITHDSGAAKLYAFEITAAGVNSTPVVSPGSTVCQYNIGLLKASPDMRHVAFTNWVSGSAGTCNSVELYDFDRATGIFSNRRVVSANTEPYGIEFSPDSKKLYVSHLTVAKIYQYDITLSSAAAITASQYLVAGPFGPAFGDLKLGPDGMIYAGGSQTHAKLDRISKPNLAGAACTYDTSVVSIGGPYANYGMPNLYWASTSPIVSDSGTFTVCAGSKLILSALPGGTWSSSNTGVAIVTSTGSVGGISPGTAIITYTGPCGRSTAVVTVKHCPTAGMDELASTRQFRIYPNPAHNELTIDIPGADNEVSIVLTDVLGRARTFNATSVGGKVSLDLSGIAPGNYLVKVDANGTTYRSRVVVAE